MRTASQFPEVNRFVVNKKVYARNEFAIGMVVLKSLKDHNGTMSKMYFKVTDTIFDVNKTIDDYVSENQTAPEKNKTEKFIKFIFYFPIV